MKKISLFCTLLSAICLLSVPIKAAIGDPGVTYDPSGAVNSFFAPKQQHWAKAGVVGGIRNPRPNSINIAVGATSGTIQSQIDTFSKSGGGVVKFPAGTWNITSTLEVPKNIVLEGVGDGRVSGSPVTILKDVLSSNGTPTTGMVIRFNQLGSGHTVGGIRKMKLLGPLPGTPDRANFKNVQPNYDNIFVNINKSQNIFLDEVTILNSGSTALGAFNTGGVGYHTIRNCIIDGAWNKGGGGEGYLNVMSAHCLIYNNTIKNLRHFALQKSGAEYNVVYGNIINIDVNFHDIDSGNNLIERNRITIDSVIAKGRYVVMGPWSNAHDPSSADNYVYNNIVSEFGRTPRCADPGFVYTGAHGYEPNKDRGNNPFAKTIPIGTGKKLYSVKPK